MDLIWPFLLLLGIAEASYLRDGCLVRDNINPTVDIDSSLNFTIRRPLSPDTEITISSQYVTLKIQDPLPNDSPNIWSDVQLLFYPQFELRLADGGLVFGSTDDAELQEPPQTLSVVNAEILTHCPQEEPVWYMEANKTLALFLDGNDSVVIIPQDETLQVKLTLNESPWYVCTENSVALTLQPDLQLCNFTKREEYKISFVKGKDKIEIHNTNKILKTIEYNGKDAMLRIELTEGMLHLVHLPQLRKGNSGAIPEEQQTADSCTLMLRLFITFLVLFIAILVLDIVVYIRLPTRIKEELLPCKTTTAAFKVSHESEVTELPEEAPSLPKRPVVPSSSDGSYGSHRLLNQASRQNSKNSNKDRAGLNKWLPNNKAYSDEQDDASKVGSVTRRQLPPSDPCKRETDYDYISPQDVHKVRPSEVAILKHENAITGNVTPRELMEKYKEPVHEVEDDYLSFGGENTGEPNQDEYLVMGNPNMYQTGYTPTYYEESLYANYPC